MSSSANKGKGCRYIFKGERRNGVDRLDMARVDENEELSQESTVSTLALTFPESENWRNKPSYDSLVEVLGVGEVNGSERTIPVEWFHGQGVSVHNVSLTNLNHRAAIRKDSPRSVK